MHECGTCGERYKSRITRDVHQDYGCVMNYSLLEKEIRLRKFNHLVFKGFSYEQADALLDLVEGSL